MKKVAEMKNCMGRIVKWIYSGKHPQQKYYKGLYEVNNEREARLEKERAQRDEAQQ